MEGNEGEKKKSEFVDKLILNNRKKAKMNSCQKGISGETKKRR